MHHKIIRTDERVVTGSANFTKAQKDNMENILLTKDPLLVEEYRQEMKRLKSYCKECKKDDAAKA